MPVGFALTCVLEIRLQVLIEKEWLAFGHMFTNRTYAPHSAVERSPIFVLFLDCVWQILQQFP